MTESMPIERARLMLHDIKQALAEGTKHYRISDGQLLETPAEILTTLLAEEVIRLQLPEAQPDDYRQRN